MARDPVARQKYIAGSENVNEYDRMLAYGQVIIHDMLTIQQRMASVPHARGRRPKNAREELAESLTVQWNECVEKLQGAQTVIESIEAERNKKEPLLITNPD